MPNPNSLDNVRAAATATIQRLSALVRDRLSDPGDVLTFAAQISLANVALAAANAPLGTCAMDGTEMFYAGRPDGLYVCCTAHQQHCWKVGA